MNFINVFYHKCILYICKERKLSNNTSLYRK